MQAWICVEILVICSEQLGRLQRILLEFLSFYIDYILIIYNFIPVKILQCTITLY